MPVYFSEGDGIAMFVGRGGKALHTVEVAGAGNVEHGDADGLKLAAAQRSTGKIGAIPQLAHGGAHALLVSRRTLGESCTVRETVCSETPARRATSLTETDFLTAAIGRSFYVNDAIEDILRSHFEHL